MASSKKRASDVPLDQLDEKNTMRRDDRESEGDEGRCVPRPPLFVPTLCCSA